MKCHLKHGFFVRLPGGLLSFRDDLEACVSLEEADEEELALITLQRNLDRIRKDLQRVLLRRSRDGHIRDAFLRAASEERARIKRRVEVEGPPGQV